jgi:hypothetical protein
MLVSLLRTGTILISQFSYRNEAVNDGVIFRQLSASRPMLWIIVHESTSYG